MGDEIRIKPKTIHALESMTPVSRVLEISNLPLGKDVIYITPIIPKKEDSMWKYLLDILIKGNDRKEIVERLKSIIEELESGEEHYEEPSKEDGVTEAYFDFF